VREISLLMSEISLLMTKTASEVTLIVVLYAVIARGMFSATEPLRDEMIQIASRLLNDENINETQKRRVRRALSDVHSVRKAREITLLLFFLIMTSPFHSFDSPKPDKDMVPEYMRDSLRQFQVLWIISTIANSPAAAVIFTLLVFIVAAFTQSFRALSGILIVRYHG
jgi:hypothetical protein